MNENVSKAVLDQALAKQTEDIVSVLHGFMDQVAGRFASVDERLETIERDMAAKDDVRQIERVIDGYASKLDMYASEMAAMQHKINRLERYIQALADKTGVDLDKIHA